MAGAFSKYFRDDESHDKSEYKETIKGTIVPKASVHGSVDGGSKYGNLVYRVFDDIDKPPIKVTTLEEMKEESSKINKDNLHEVANGLTGDLRGLLLKLADKDSITDVKKKKIAVLFSTDMGEVTAPFNKVIVGDFCVALIQDLEEVFQYTPAISDSRPFKISFQTGSVRNTFTVLNLGINFMYSNSERVLVLIQDYDKKEESYDT